MKKIIFPLLLLILAAFSVRAQTPDIRNVGIINFYGVDFSKAKIFGAAEPPTRLKNGIIVISQLFISESNKYDIERYLGKRARYYSLKSVNNNNDNIDADELIATSRSNELSEADIDAIVSSLTIDNPSGTGLIIIGEMLNKLEKIGIFQFVFFDEASREIIYSKVVSGKPRGVGVRNYWAASVLNAMKRWEY